MSLAWVHETPVPRNWHSKICRNRQSRPQQGRHPVDVGLNLTPVRGFGQPPLPFDHQVDNVRRFEPTARTTPITRRKILFRQDQMLPDFILRPTPKRGSLRYCLGRYPSHASSSDTYYLS